MDLKENSQALLMMMIMMYKKRDIVYCCYSGAHRSVVCAAIHLMMFADFSKPDIDDIIEIINFGMKRQEKPNINFMGYDKEGIRIFTCGVKNNLSKYIVDIKRMFNNPLIIDCSVYMHSYLFFGGIMGSKGDRLCAKGIIKIWNKLMKISAS